MNYQTHFIDQLHTLIEPVLRQAGFMLVERQSASLEVLVYERPNPVTSKPDRITFHDDEEHSPIISCEIISGLKPGTFLKTLKELLPDFPILSYPQANRWSYSTQEELERVLQEIVDLVKNRLLDWFENPVQNPSGMSAKPEIVMNREEIARSIEGTIRLFELLAREARKKGDMKEAEEHEQAVREYQQQLLNIKS